MRLEGIQKKSDKNNKESKKLQLQGEIREIRINYFTNLIETFKIINGIFNLGRHYSIFLLELEIYCQHKFQKLSLLTNWIIFANIFLNKLPN